MMFTIVSVFQPLRTHDVQMVSFLNCAGDCFSLKVIPLYQNQIVKMSQMAENLKGRSVKVSISLQRGKGMELDDFP